MYRFIQQTLTDIENHFDKDDVETLKKMLLNIKEQLL